ncbi:MAG: hypothetical protein M1837_004835 [Sclerophora amabilis]|nr:MAG: hypothetical protein M1837_004835 [Sclerophora amabilis]
MSAPQPPTLPPTSKEEEQYARVKHNLALGLLVTCPLILALPPRKMDWYSFSLGGAWLLSANQLTKERSGRGLLEHFGSRVPARNGMPTERATEVQDRLRREKLLRAQPSGQGDERGSMMGQLWMGQEKEGWQKRRLENEREAMEDGRGYQGLIMDQISEVWNWGKKDEPAHEDREELESRPEQNAGGNTREDS